MRAGSGCGAGATDLDHRWIAFSIAAAFFQTLRLAGLKQANQSLNVLVATMVRSLFGLPVLLLYLAGVLAFAGGTVPEFNARFVIMCTIAGLTQYFSTALLVYAFQLRNFAVGTMLVKADVIITAVVGSLLFSERITPGGWAAIAVTVAGVLMVSAARIDPSKLTEPGESVLGLLVSYPTQICLASAAMFATSYLCLREGLLAIDGSTATRAAWAAVTMTATQLVLVGPWLLRREPNAIAAILSVKWLAAFVGLMSALGTIFWFMASTLANASYVAAVAQVQIVFALAISWAYFKERINRLELAGMLVILAGILSFRFL